MKLKLFASLTLAALLTPVWSTGLAQQEKPPPVVFQLTWIDADQMQQLLLSFFEGGIRANSTLNVIAFSGTEKERILVEELIKRYDVPPAGLEFQFHVLRASSKGEGLRDGVPEFVKNLLGEIGALTRFKAFELIDSPILRAREGRWAEISGEGPLAYKISLNPRQVADEGETTTIRIDECSVEYRIVTGYTTGGRVLDAEKAEADVAKAKERGVDYVVQPLYKTAGMRTSFNIADGETIVLGASRMPTRESGGDWAIITVVTARILR